MAESAKDRVYVAAEHISAEQTPTVSAVREAAAVSMADASRYLKQWKQEQATATAAVVAAPGTITDQAAKLAGTLWAEAVKLAGEDHRAVQAVWEAEKTELSAEVDELVTAADAAEAAHRKETDAAAQALTAAEERVAAAERRAEAAQQANAEAETENGRLREQLAAAGATATSVQTAMDAVLARIGTGSDGGGVPSSPQK